MLDRLTILTAIPALLVFSALVFRRAKKADGPGFLWWSNIMFWIALFGTISVALLTMLLTGIAYPPNTGSGVFVFGFFLVGFLIACLGVIITKRLKGSGIVQSVVSFPLAFAGFIVGPYVVFYAICAIGECI